MQFAQPRALCIPSSLSKHPFGSGPLEHQFSRLGLNLAKREGIHLIGIARSPAIQAISILRVDGMLRHALPRLGYGFPGRSHLMLAATAILLIALFVKITADLADHDDIQRWDHAAVTFVADHRTLSLDRTILNVTALGSPAVVALFTVAGFVVLGLGRNRRDAFYWLVSIAGAGILDSVVKHLVQRPRPASALQLVRETTFSFPSGHATGITAVLLAAAFLSFRHFPFRSHRVVLLIAALVGIALVGFTRIYLGVHYPSDVAGGILLASAWVLSMTLLFAAWPKSAGTPFASVTSSDCRRR